MTTQTHDEELLEPRNDGMPSPREAEDTEFEFEPTIVRGRE